jgi:flagellar biosynthesis GTPase FlhF
MVLQGLADAGDYRYSELSEQELRERLFFPFFPSARALRPRTAEQELKGVGTPAPLLAATAAVSTSTARKLNVMPVGVDFLTAQLSAISPPDYEGAGAAAGCGEAVAVTPRVVEERALEAARLEEEERVRKEEANAEKERERELERARKEEEKAAKERERELERVRREEEKAAKEQSKEEERLRKAAEKEAERVAKGEAKEIEKLMKEMLKEVERRDKEETRMQKKRGNAAPAAAAEQGGARQVKRNKKR